jgi:malate/lactate dehydrogenase
VLCVMFAFAAVLKSNFCLGVAVDLSHIPTGAEVKGHSGGADALAAALKGSDVVVIPAGVSLFFAVRICCYFAQGLF